MTQRAAFETRSAWVGSEFGEGFARRRFGDAAVDALPRYSKGKSAGKFKANIVWLKCTAGGWVGQGSTLQGEAVGRVENRRGAVLAAALVSNDGAECFATDGDPRYFRQLGV